MADDGLPTELSASLSELIAVEQVSVVQSVQGLLEHVRRHGADLRALQREHGVFKQEHAQVRDLCVCVCVCVFVRVCVAAGA